MSRGGWLLIVAFAAGLVGLVAGEPENPSADCSPGKDLALPDHDRPVRVCAGEVHSRDVELAAGDFVHAFAGQDGMDLVVRLVDAAGEVLHLVDSPNGRYGPEELAAAVPTAGRYRIEVVAPSGEAPPAVFTFALEAPRPATADDRDLVTADRAYHQGWRQVNGSPRQAIAQLRPTVETWRRLGRPLRLAGTLQELCLAHSSVGEPGPGVDACEEAIVLYRAFEDRGREVRGPLATTLRNAGLAYLTLGAARQAREPLRQAAQRAESQGDLRGLVLSLSWLGTAEARLGELRSALRLFGRALETARGLGRADTLALALLESADALAALDRSGEAAERYAEAREVYAGLGQRRDEATALDGLAYTSFRLGDLEAAERHARQAVALLHSEDDARRRAIALHTLGRIREHGADRADARRAYENALTLARRGGDAHTEAMILLSLGHLDVVAGDPANGLPHLDAAQELFAAVDHRPGTASSRVRGAEALRDLGRLEEAWQRLAPALDTVESLRGEAARGDFRLSYFAFRQEYYEIAFDLLMRLDTRQPAAGWAGLAVAVNDRRLSRELLDALAYRALPDEEAAPELLAQERRLEAALRKAAAVPSGETRRPRIVQLLGELHRTRGELRQARIAASPAVTPPAALDLAAVRDELLDDETLLLVYALGESRSFLWVLSPAGLASHELPGRSLWEADAERFRRETARFRERSRRQSAALGRRLGDLLLGPVAGSLHESRRLVLITEGALDTLPFAALRPPGAVGGTHLIERWEIVRVPSIAAVLSRRRLDAGRPPPAKTAVLFVDPVFGPDDPRLAEIGTLSSDLSTPGGGDGETTPFARLAATRRERQAIEELLGAERVEVAEGFAAHREAFLSTSFAGRGVLHVATHAVVDDTAELSGILLSRLDAAGRRRDGFVRVFEISRLDLPVDLASLSACRTGRGTEVRGEGTVGLAWSFLQAGAARVVSTLWEVDDGPAAELMRRFYAGYLGEGLAPSAALRRAQLELRAEGAPPETWAAFVVQGDWRPPPWTRGGDVPPSPSNQGETP